MRRLARSLPPAFPGTAELRGEHPAPHPSAARGPPSRPARSSKCNFVLRRKFKELLVNELCLVNLPLFLAENLAFTYGCGERGEHKGKESSHDRFVTFGR
ncbi:unnamed protein product [Coccothraustes coccothraustes]